MGEEKRERDRSARDVDKIKARSVNASAVTPFQKKKLRVSIEKGGKKGLTLESTP